MATEYFLAADGNDQTADGTEQNPYKTLGAISSLTNGDVVLLKDGKYASVTGWEEKVLTLRGASGTTSAVELDHTTFDLYTNTNLTLEHVTVNGLLNCFQDAALTLRYVTFRYPITILSGTVHVMDSSLIPVNQPAQAFTCGTSIAGGSNAFNLVVERVVINNVSSFLSCVPQDKNAQGSIIVRDVKLVRVEEFGRVRLPSSDLSFVMDNVEVEGSAFSKIEVESTATTKASVAIRNMVLSGVAGGFEFRGSMDAGMTNVSVVDSVFEAEDHVLWTRDSAVEVALTDFTVRNVTAPGELLRMEGSVTFVSGSIANNSVERSALIACTLSLVGMELPSNFVFTDNDPPLRRNLLGNCFYEAEVDDIIPVRFCQDDLEECVSCRAACDTNHNDDICRRATCTMDCFASGVCSKPLVDIGDCYDRVSGSCENPLKYDPRYHACDVKAVCHSSKATPSASPEGPSMTPGMMEQPQTESPDTDLRAPSPVNSPDVAPVSSAASPTTSDSSRLSPMWSGLLMLVARCLQ